MHKTAIALLLALTTVAPSGALAAPAVAESRQAFELAREALLQYQAGRFEVAAALYRRAYALQPKTHEYLFGEARSLLAAGSFDQAKGQFAAVCAAVGKEHPLCQRSERHLAEAAQRAKPSPPGDRGVALPTSATPDAGAAAPLAIGQLPDAIVEPPASLVGAPSAARPWRVPAAWAWSAVGFAAMGVAAGAGLAASAFGQQADLDAHKLSDGRFDASRISYAEARSAQQSINNQWWGAGAAAIAAVVGAGAATYLFQRTKPAPQFGSTD